MRILFSAQNFLNDVGGAEISAQTLLKHLAKKHEVHVISRGQRGEYEWEGINVHEIKCPNRIPYINLFWGRHLDKLKLKPDLVITQVNAAAPTVFWSKKNKIPCIFYVRSFEHFCLDGFKGGDVFKCGQRCMSCGGVKGILLSPAINLILKRNMRAIQTADLVVTQTQFMREVVAHYSKKQCDVLPNLMDLEAVHTDEHGDAVLFINPLKHKGIDLVAKLVKRMPNRKFTLVGGIEKGYEWLKDEPNVDNLRFVKDMRVAYSKAHVVLVPSDMADSSPRVVFEAMYNGIPCITSNVGGAAEVGGEAAIRLDKCDVEGWAETINLIYEEVVFYEERSKASRKYAKEYTLGKSINAMESLVEKKLGLRL
jgi:glycosyltransferase involved in cell wall biosynthesis